MDQNPSLSIRKVDSRTVGRRGHVQLLIAESLTTEAPAAESLTTEAPAAESLTAEALNAGFSPPMRRSRRTG
jgi:hypothetical protein